MEHNNQPLVSVVIPCYNHEQFVQDCIQSVIDQTYENIELIIIDDGSQDNSVEKIQQMVSKCERRFNRFEFRFRSNKGLCVTLNEAIDWSHGKYFSVLASDDLIIDDKIEFQVKYLQNNPKCGGVFGRVKVIHHTDICINKISDKNNIKIKKHNFKDVSNHNFDLWAPTQLIRLNLVNQINGFHESVILEDWYMWLKITELNYSLDSINKIFAFYRRHDGNMSSRVDRMHKGRIDVIKLFENNHNIQESVANIYLVTANDYLTVDRSKAFYFFKMSIIFYFKFCYRVKFNLKIIKFIMKYLVT